MDSNFLDAISIYDLTSSHLVHSSFPPPEEPLTFSELQHEFSFDLHAAISFPMAHKRVRESADLQVDKNHPKVCMASAGEDRDVYNHWEFFGF
jgi:hypothetical protein